MEHMTSEDVGEFYQHYPRIAAVITARSGDADNAMTAAWHTPISFKPPLYGVAVSPKRRTYRMIVEVGEFGVNFLPATDAELVAGIGGSKGDEVDKFDVFNIAKAEAVKTRVPLLASAYAAYECRLVDDRPYGDHRLLVGEIVATHWLASAFNEDGVLNLDAVSPVLYIGNEEYVTASNCSIKRLEREVYGKKSQ